MVNGAVQEADQFNPAIAEVVASDEYRALAQAMQWTGDTPETALATAREIQHDPTSFTDEDFREAAMFMAGQQWDPAHVKIRTNNGIPCMVINKLQIVYSYAVGMCLKDDPLTDEQKEMLLVKLWRRNVDAQRFHNWSISRYIQLVAASAVPANLEKEEIPQ